MESLLTDRWYTWNHEWFRAIRSGTLQYGLTPAFFVGVSELEGLELPVVGAAIVPGGSLGMIEFSKTVFELQSPIAGTIVRVNESLRTTPNLLLRAPYSDGWIVELDCDGDELESLRKTGTLVTGVDYFAQTSQITNSTMESATGSESAQDQSASPRTEEADGR